MGAGSGLGALQACEERFRNLIARNADAIVVVDRAGAMRFVNPAAETLFQRPAATLVGSHFGFPVVAGETTEVDVVGTNGALTAAEMRVMETEWEGVPALLAVLRDCTERKRADAERAALLREQIAHAEAEQALRERDAFFAVASHELRTPLTTLSGTAQLLRRQLDRPEALDHQRVRTALRRVDDQARRVARLVSRLLDVADINAGTLGLTRRRADLVPLVRGVATERQAATGAHSITVRAPDRLEAVVDPARIEQLLWTLLDNAIRYSPDGGAVEVDLVSEGPAVRLAVRDHGLGIPPERRGQLFERFSRAHAEGYVSGLGLGLFISRQVVELHGGHIAAQFPDDGGSCFVVHLPVAGEPLKSPTAAR